MREHADYSNPNSAPHPNSARHMDPSYARVCEPLIEFRNPLEFLSNLLLSFASALALFVLIPITRWIATPPAPDFYPCNPDTFVQPAPKDLYVPPPPTPRDEPDEPDEEIKFRPSIADLEIGTLKIGDGGFSLPSLSFDSFEVPTIDDILDIGDVDVIPRPVKTIAPNYPADMRRNGVEDRVIIEFIVDERGYVDHPMILKGKYDSFNKASLDAIRRWRFEPGEKNGTPVKVRMRLPLDFKVNP